jgi:replicative DNA helicase
MASDEVLPPNSREAEDSVVGALLMDAIDLPEVVAVLRPEHFYWAQPRTIYEAVLAVHERGEDVDNLTVIEELRETDKLEQAGGSPGITKAMNDTPSFHNVQTYAGIVQAAFIRRRGIVAAEKIATTFWHSRETVDVILSSVEQELFAVRDGYRANDVITAHDLAMQLFDQVEHRYNNQGVPAGLSTGFASLDQRLGGGFGSGDLVVIAARPGFGKTTLMLNIADNAAQRDRAVGVFSLEMTAEQLGYRLAASRTNINAQKFRQGNLDGQEWSTFTREIGNIAKMPIYLDGSKKIGIRQMVAKCKRMHKQYNLSLIVIDYLQLMVGDSDRKSENRTLEIGDITRNLKLLAGELGIPIILASQLNRAVESRADKRPQLSDLRQSGDIEQDADTVMFIYRDEMYNEGSNDRGVAEIIIGKQRNGPTGMVRLGFSGGVTRFSDGVSHHTIDLTGYNE